MATKEQNLKRLDELALILGREPDISGSAAEIAQRVAEWEEEIQSSGEDVRVGDGGDTGSGERETAADDVREDTSGALTRIRVLTCLHLCGIDGETGDPVEIADVGRVILIMSSDAKTHVDGGMAVYA
ncbi:DNA-packaging protein FI [Escherichia coli]|nr:DNA-packaging protein FI [Escherichia coli]